MLKKIWNYFIKVSPFLTLIFLLMGILYGYGVLNKPKLSVSCGAINLRTPPTLVIDMMLLKSLFISKDKFSKFLDDIAVQLKKMNFPKEKLDKVIKNIETMKKQNEPIHTEKLNLEPYEENILKYAAVVASRGFMGDIMEEYKIPKGVLFFEIQNNGRADAKNARVNVKLNGVGYDVNIDTENKLLNKKMEYNNIILEFAGISPKSRTKLIVWYTEDTTSLHDKPAISTRSLDEDEIAVTYEGGDTIRKHFAEDAFFLSQK